MQFFTLSVNSNAGQDRLREKKSDFCLLENVLTILCREARMIIQKDIEGNVYFEASERSYEPLEKEGRWNKESF
jgi:hypothetical protein